jgi:tetratricopeptide (TPR) repeat protein
LPPPSFWGLLLLASMAGWIGWLAGCNGWSPSEPFRRNAPEVDQAIRELDAGAYDSAQTALQEYLGTGACSDAGIGLPPKVRKRADGAFDLGLTLFHLAERYGQRFGEEEVDAGPTVPEDDNLRNLEIDCALIITQAIAHDASVPIELRARAHYLSGNLEFMRRRYEDAVKHYDRALELVPGVVPEAGGDEVGRNAAWNRAIALRRIQEEQQQDGGPDAEPDAEPDAQPDAEPDSGDGDDQPDAGEDAGDDGGDGGDGEDGGADADSDPPDGGGEDGGEDGGADEDQNDPPPAPDEAEPPPQSEQSQMDRILDQLEEAPTYQEEEAKKRAAAGRRRVMEDK